MNLDVRGVDQTLGDQATSRVLTPELRPRDKIDALLEEGEIGTPRRLS